MDTVGSALSRGKIISSPCLLRNPVRRCGQGSRRDGYSRAAPPLELSHLAMKNKKATKKFAASGKLKQTIKARHKHQKLKKQIDGRRQRKAANEQNAKAGTKRTAAEDVDMDGGDSDEGPSRPPKVSSKGKSNVKPQKQIDIKKSFLDGEDDEVRCELTLSYLGFDRVLGRWRRK